MVAMAPVPWTTIDAGLCGIPLVAADTGRGTGEVGVVGAEVSIICAATLRRRFRVDPDPSCFGPGVREGEEGREGMEKGRERKGGRALSNMCYI